MSADIDRYAVFGNPIAHSQSPRIHTLFAEQTGQHLSYTATLVEQGQFDIALRQFADNNGKGINITVPFKQDAYKAATTLTPRAQRAGAVNTIIIEENNYTGDNTDGVGLVSDLVTNNNIILERKRILVIGAGGATRGVLQPLLEHGPAELVIANRTKSKAVQLTRDFSDLGVLAGRGLDELEHQAFDIVINATSASLQDEIPPVPHTIFNDDAVCYDMMYAAQPTPFLQWAASLGVTTTLDGLGMLVEQAAESFYLWRNVRPDTAPVIKAVRSALRSNIES